MTDHRMLIISTGGTIAGEVAKDKKIEGYEIAKADKFSETLGPTLEYIMKDQTINIIPTAHEFAEVDSSDILPKHWKGLADLIHEKYDEFDSFIITHGTNTMGYTSAALSFALYNSGKPIVLTGSQVPIAIPGSDASTNLDNAIRVAIWNQGFTLRGVSVVFGSHIITGTRAKKSTEFDYDAFASFNSGSLGRIGRIIQWNKANVDRHLSYQQTARYPVANRQDQLRISSSFDTRILSLTEFPGLNPEFLLNAVKNNDVRGVIFRAFGAGDASTHLHQAFKDLKEKEIPVVVTTQAPNGNATLQVNEPGQYLSKENLVIPAFDMSIESQTTKLAWLLAKKERKEINFQQLCEEMIVDIRGEINVLWE